MMPRCYKRTKDCGKRQIHPWCWRDQAHTAQLSFSAGEEAEAWSRSDMQKLQSLLGAEQESELASRVPATLPSPHCPLIQA